MDRLQPPRTYHHKLAVVQDLGLVREQRGARDDERQALCHKLVDATKRFFQRKHALKQSIDR